MIEEALDKPDRIGYSVATLAAAVDLSVDSIQRAIKSGDLVANYFGTKPLIAPAEAQRWFDNLPNEHPRRAS